MERVGSVFSTERATPEQQDKALRLSCPDGTPVHVCPFQICVQQSNPLVAMAPQGRHAHTCDTRVSQIPKQQSASLAQIGMQANIVLAVSSGPHAMSSRPWHLVKLPMAHFSTQ